MKVVVYSANFGQRDELLEMDWDERFEFHYFTERPVAHDVWRFHEPPVVFESQRKMARWCKLHSHVLFPDADVTIWVDSSMHLFEPVSSFLDYAEDGCFCSFEHPMRACAYDEGKYVMAVRIESWEKVRSQLRSYRMDGYPRKNGLLETQVVVRRHASEVGELNEAWWEQLERFSLRDQVSLPYVLWKFGIEPVIMPHGLAESRGHLR